MHYASRKALHELSSCISMFLCNDNDILELLVDSGIASRKATGPNYRSTIYTIGNYVIQ